MFVTVHVRHDVKLEKRGGGVNFPWMLLAAPRKKHHWKTRAGIESHLNCLKNRGIRLGMSVA
jgi:hypothetical protein